MLIHSDTLMLHLHTVGCIDFRNHSLGDGTEQVIVIGSLHRDLDDHCGDFIRESLSGFEVSLALGFDFFFLCFDLFESDSGSRCGIVVCLS